MEFLVPFFIRRTWPQFLTSFSKKLSLPGGFNRMRVLGCSPYALFLIDRTLFDVSVFD